MVACASRRCFVPGLVLVLVSACTPRPGLPEDAATCALTFTDSGDVRVFVVGHAFRLEDAVSYETFERSVGETMAQIAPCRSQARPNLVLFPESIGIIPWFGGRRGMLARGASDTETAFNAMYAGYYPIADRYRSRFPGISAARSLALALGDRAWRAMDRGFGAMAKRYGVYVMTSANVPRVTRVEGGEGEPYRDVEAPGSDAAYVATGPEVFNTSILYGPDGALHSTVDKVYLTETEEESLDLSSGPLETLQVMDLPFARIGVAISRDAFYAPFTQRMEDLGVEFVVQPEAWSGWAVQEIAGDWAPDVILTSGWSHTQKYRSFRHNATPMLLGNLFDIVFDGQTWITQKATPQQELKAFVGSLPLPGWLALGPWSMEDPLVADPTLSLEARRERLRELGRKLAPGSGAEEEGAYQRALIGADLTFYGESAAPAPIAVTPTGGPSSRVLTPVQAGGHQSHPEGAFDAAGALYTVFTDTRSGIAQVYLTVSTDQGATWSAPVAVETSTTRQVRPAVAASAPGTVVVAWQEARDGAEQIRIASSTNGGLSFNTRALVQATASAQWEPDLAFSPEGRSLVVVWTDFREGLAPKVRISRSSDLGATWSASERVDPSNEITAKVEGSQLQPTVAWSSAGLAVSWIDYRRRDWAVWAAVAAGAGSFAPAAQVSPPAKTVHDVEVEVLGSDPQLAAAPDGDFVLTWDDQRDRRGHHDVRLARFNAATGWTQLPTLLGGAEAGAFVSRFRPSVGVFGTGASANTVHAVFQDLTPGKNALYRLTVGATAPTPISPTRFDDTGSAANQMTRPRLVVRKDFTGAVVLFEDDRDGFSRIRVSDPL
jgi:predicted amidohydrolase